jgi:hypothetical protein
MELAQTVVLNEISRIVPARVPMPADASRDESSLPAWLVQLADSFEARSAPFPSAWATGSFRLYVLGANQVTDRACAHFLTSADAGVDSLTATDREAKLREYLRDIPGTLRSQGLLVSERKEGIARRLVETELRCLTSHTWSQAACARIECFFWSFLMTLTEATLAYFLRSPQMLQSMVAICCAFTIIDDAVDVEEDTRANSPTLFTRLPLAQARAVARSMLSACCESVVQLDGSFLPFVAMNTAVLQDLCAEDRGLLQALGVQNVACACALAVAVNETRGTLKRVFDVSVFMNELGKERGYLESCALV